MITDDNNRWHYLAVKLLPALLSGITSNHHGDFYFLNCFHSYTTHNKVKHMKNKIPTWRKVIKSSFYNLCRFRMSTKKKLSCKNNSENSYTEKKVKHQPSGCAWCSICLFNDTKNRRYFYRRKDCIEKFCKDLKELGTEIINFEDTKRNDTINESRN